MKLTSGMVYQYGESKEVLVLDVHHVFDEYDLGRGTGRLRTRVVRHTDEWDGYGPMPSSVRTTPVDEFRSRVDNPIRTVEFVNPTEENRAPDTDERR
jgi:hypothetical protein